MTVVSEAAAGAQRADRGDDHRRIAVAADDPVHTVGDELRQLALPSGSEQDQESGAAVMSKDLVNETGLDRVLGVACEVQQRDVRPYGSERPQPLTRPGGFRRDSHVLPAPEDVAKAAAQERGRAHDEDPRHAQLRDVVVSGLVVGGDRYVRSERQGGPSVRESSSGVDEPRAGRSARA
ncbi:hypothetical protein ACL02T_27675 [Pseudonocardia sp. RS010]|uniref:hypothetical protein n=1 Tax=Pseudonocardia sp. RS010 TaxID=3385979 RepID=UPI0039A1A2D3